MLPDRIPNTPHVSEAVFSAWFFAKWLYRRIQLGRFDLRFKTPTCEDMNLGADELNHVGVFGVGSCKIMARKLLGYE
jgi:hypothetical protein